MIAKRRAIAVLLILSLLLAGASLLVAGADPPPLEPLSALKATEGKPFSELSAPSGVSGRQADAENVELVGQIGGDTYAVAVQENYAS